MNNRKFWYKWINLHAGCSWFLLTSFFQRELFWCLPKVDHVANFQLGSCLYILFQLAYQMLIIIKNVEAAGWKYKLHERFWGKNLPSDKKYVYTMSASKIGNDIITVVRSAAAVSAQFIKSSLNPNLHSFLFPWSPKLFSGSLNPYDICLITSVPGSNWSFSG